MFEIGISSASFFGKCVTEEAVDNLNKFDIKVAEIFVTTFSEYHEDFIKILKNRQNGLKVHSVHAQTNQYEPQLFNSYERTRLDSEKIFRQVCRAAQILKAKNYTFHGPFNVKKIKDFSLDFQKMAIIFNHLIEICSEYNVRLCLENVHWTLFPGAEELSNLYRYVSNKLGACLDIKQAAQAGVDYKKIMNVMGKRLQTVHLCDYDDNLKLTLPGKGIFDFVTLFKRLLDDDFKGAALIEVYGNDYNKYDELLDSYQYIKDCYEKAKH